MRESIAFIRSFVRFWLMSHSEIPSANEGQTKLMFPCCSCQIHKVVFFSHSPFVQLNLPKRLDFWDKRFQRLGMRLEHLEEGYGADGLDVGLENDPTVAENLLLVGRQEPFGL